MRCLISGLVLFSIGFLHGAEIVSEIPDAAETFEAAIDASRCSKWADDEHRLRIAYTNCVAHIENPAQGIVVPIESFPNGALKIAATAGRAQFFEKDGLVWCAEVTVREYSETGVEKMSFNASGCVVDRKTKSGWLEGRAHGSYGKTDLAGDGIYFSFPDEFVKISSKVEILSTEFKFEGVKL